VTARLHSALGAMPPFGAAVIAASISVSPATAGGSRPDQPTGGLTIAILDLAEVPTLAPPKPVRAEQSAWRTSFGSERKSEPKVKASSPDSPLAAIADADAVLIQGVHAAAGRGSLGLEGHQQVHDDPVSRPPIHEVAGLHEHRGPADPLALTIDQARTLQKRHERAVGTVNIADGNDPQWGCGVERGESDKCSDDQERCEVPDAHMVI